MMYPPYDPNDPSNWQGQLITTHSNEAPVAVLTVSDVERIAKAGVKLEWAEIKHQVRPEPIVPHDNLFDCSQLLRPLVARIRQAHMNRETRGMTSNLGGFVSPAFLSAATYGDKVYVFVAPMDKPPVIIEDDANLYPSDALMAKLFLMDTFHKEK